jgi:hypothetical protein
MTSFKRRKENTLDKLESDLTNNNKDNPAMTLAMNYLRVLGKNRRPMTMVPRTAAQYTRTNSKGSNYTPTVKPPYNNAHLDRFEDCFRSDKLVQNGIVKRTELVIGQHGKIILDVTDEYDTQDDRNEALKKINNNTTYQDAKKQIQKLHMKEGINFHNKLKAAVIQAKVYGRSAIELIGSDTTATTADNTTGISGLSLPQSLHVLNSKRIGQVEIDPTTWEFLGCRYLDLDKGPSGMDDLLEADQLIYFANRDFHVSPGSLYYGLSELEGVIDGSDSKRIAKQEDIKEIMKSNWAPFLILKFINPNISVSQMQEIVNGLQPGLPFAHKQDIETEKIDLSSDLQKLTECVDFLNRESLRELGVPAFLGGYEQIANYANSQQVLLSYREIELQADRTWIKDIIQPQWLNKLFYQILGIEDYDENIPEVKLSYEFEDVSFETTLDKINSSLLLFDRSLISGEKVLKIAGYEDEIEEYKLRKEEEDRRKLEMQKQFLNKKLSGDDSEDDTADDSAADEEDSGSGEMKDGGRRLPKKPFGRQVTSTSTTNKKRQASIDADLYHKFEETLDAIRDG